MDTVLCVPIVSALYKKTVHIRSKFINSDISASLIKKILFYINLFQFFIFKPFIRSDGCIISKPSPSKQLTLSTCIYLSVPLSALLVKILRPPLFHFHLVFFILQLVNSSLIPFFLSHSLFRCQFSCSSFLQYHHLVDPWQTSFVPILSI